MQCSFEPTIERLRSSPASAPDGRFEGRGIVICAGGARYFTCAWVLIFILRRVHRSRLPIQVWHLGRREMSDEMRILLSEEGIEIVDAETVAARHPARLAGGWPLKPYAIAQSRFREVLYLDADTVPFVDPQVAFEWDEYRDNGLLLWPDAVNIAATNPVWERLGLAPAETDSIDSGVLLVDKARAWPILELAVVMNEHCHELYDVLYGDKDTFLLSARLLDRTFGRVPHRPFRFEWDLVQRDPAGDPFLHHRTSSKWLLNRPNRPLALPTLAPSCEAALADLRSRWSGIVFHPPERSARARAEEARLVAQRYFRLEPSVGGAREIELLAGARVGAGRERERHWAIVDRPDSLVLWLYGNDGELIASLERIDHGHWRGETCEPGCELLLTARPDGIAAHAEKESCGARSAEEHVAAIAHPALFAAGYDAEHASALGSALALLNDAFDDVPEQIVRRAAQQPMSPQWRSHLDRLAAGLAAAREERIAMMRRDPTIGPRELGQDRYVHPDR
jgi:hypothetical protein